MENDIKFYLIPNDEGEFEVYDCEYDITIVCKSKEEQDEAIKKIKKGQASLQAWDKVKAEILKEEKRTAEVGIKFGIGLALGIIDKHLGELQQEEQ